MASSDIAARMREVEAQVARKNHAAAFGIVAELVNAGVTDAAVFNSYRRLHNLLHRRDITHAQIFNFMYAADVWEGGSGAGSAPQATERYRAFLKDFMLKNIIRSVVDAGCGDWQSSQLVDWSDVDYLGIDVSSVVLNNTKRFAKDGVLFIEGDARTCELPKADLLIIKDVLQHWSNADIMAIIPKFRRFRYCLIANGATEQVKAYVNKDIVAGGYRPVDLSQPPFSVSGSVVLSYDVPYATRSDGPVCSTMQVFLVDRDKRLPEKSELEATIAPDIFAHEYDLDALQLLKPRGHEFRMYVTPRYREHYENNSYEQFSARLIPGLLRRAGLFLDIGASYGFYSLLAGSQNLNLDIIAVEPTPVTCAILNQNVEMLGRSKVVVRQLAVSDSIGSRRFNVALASDSCGFFDHPNVGTLQSIDVETTTVDALLKDRAPCPLVVKIDTEGNELAVLHGMAETLNRFPNIKLVIEYGPRMLRAADVDPKALLDHLDRLGFLTFVIDEQRQRFYRAKPEDDNLKWTGRDYANLYCVRKEHALNVCFFSHSSSLAGSERALLELVDDLIVDYGAVCSVVMPNWGPLADSIAKCGAAPIVAPYSWWCTPKGTHLTEIQKLRRLRKSRKAIMTSAVPDIRLVDPDIIWSQTMVIPWGAMMAAILRKPHVWYVTEFGERDQSFVFFSSLTKTLREIEAGSDLIYTCSKSVARELFPGASGERVRTLYCFPRVHATPNEMTGQPEQYFCVPGAVKLGIFGSLQPGKGQEDILLAVADLTRRGRNVELLLAGYELSEYRLHLENLVVQHRLSDRVCFAGMLQDPYPAMRATDIVVICSRCEAFGRAGFEAMLLGKPVIYPNTGGAQEYMVEGHTGLSYPPGDVDRLVDQLERLIADPSRRQVMGRHGRDHASKLLSTDSFSGEVNRVLLTLRAQDNSTVRIPESIRRSVSLRGWFASALPLVRGMFHQ